MKLQTLLPFLVALLLTHVVADAAYSTPAPSAAANVTVSKLSSFLPFGGKPVNSIGFKKSFISDSSSHANYNTSVDGLQVHESRPMLRNGGVNMHPYTAELKSYILHAHNKARATLVPTEAANMRQLAWDESLAIEASELVETCVFKHDTEGYQYGQNLIYGGRKLDKAIVDEWIVSWVKDEISHSDRTTGNGFMELSHASAVLWATTRLVGCASKMCVHGHFTACNYYSPGNWKRVRTYIPGKSCSQCPKQAPYCDTMETGRLCTGSASEAPTDTPAQVKAPTMSEPPQSSLELTPKRPHKLCH